MADLRGDGENIMRVSRIIPDFIAQQWNAIIQLDLRNYPNDTAASSSLGPFTVTTSTDTKSTIRTNPPSAISPSINASNSDLCMVGVSGAVQTQILGISTGQAYSDENCMRLKNAKVLYDMGMKVASVALLCQDERVFKAMSMAGTPCPYNGKIGKEASAEWEKNQSKRPDVDDAEKEYIAKCTHEVNPNRSKINKDVVGLVKKTYTRKTKTTKQCKKEFYATQ